MTEADDGAEFMTVEEVAEKFRVSNMTIYRLIQDGSLSGIRIGRNFRIHIDSVRDYVLAQANAEYTYVERGKRGQRG